MERSDNNMKELAAALCKAQGEMSSVIKSQIAQGKSFSYNYASLEDVIAVVQEPLLNNGLAVSQLMDNINGEPALTTIMMHTSGQWQSATIPLVQVKGNGTNAAQDLGISITYTKRYALAGICLVSIIDDVDGNTENKVTKQPKKQAQQNIDFDAIEPIAADEQFIVSVKVGCWETKAGKKYIGFWEDGQQYPSIPWWDGREAFLDKFTDDVMTKDGLGAKGTTYPFSAKVFYTLNDKGYKDLVRVERI